MPAVLLVIALAVLTGCGPITYIGDVRGASDAVDAARAAQAERLSPYWWTRAIEYLHKARELAGHADFQAANRYGRLSTEAANLAVQEASAAKEPAKRPVTDKPEPAPAKDPRSAPAEEPRSAPAVEPRSAPAAKPRVAPAKDTP